MRNDERFEVERAFDLLPHVTGAAWAAVWFRMKKIKRPSRTEFREKTLEYLKKMEPVFESYPKNDEFEAINKYVEFRKNEEYRKIIEGENNEIEKRYDRYIDYG